MTYMPYRRLRHIVILAITMSIVCVTSCKKFVTIPPPENQVTSLSVFSSDQSALSAMSGLYSNMMSINLYFMNGAMSVYPGLSADEIINTSSNSNVDPFYQNAIQSTNGIIENNFWRIGYSYIYQANAILEGVKRSTGISKKVADQITGEARFIRAFCYFYLLNLFGAVPLITTTDYEINGIMPRIAPDSVYDQILSDLKTANDLLSEGGAATENTRPNKWAVVSLLARVYLFEKDWSDAEKLSSDIINSGIFKLEPSPDGVFGKSSSETIWQLIPSTGYYNTAEGATFIPSSSSVVPAYVISNSLLQSFEVNDKRRSFWIDSNVVGGKVYYYPYKYKVARGSSLVEYNIVLRLAEQYLIRAEARAHENNINGARSDLNVIRNRAGLPNTIADNQAALLLAIEQEWRIEFLCEWGHRWLDLKRTGRAKAILSNIKTGWNDDDTLYPIPFSQIQTNPVLTQNKGY